MPQNIGTLVGGLKALTGSGPGARDEPFGNASRLTFGCASGSLLPPGRPSWDLVPPVCAPNGR